MIDKFLRLMLSLVSRAIARRLNVRPVTAEEADRLTRRAT